MKSCPLCQSEAVKRFELAYTIVWRCRAAGCCLQFALPQLDEATLARAYSTHYYPSNGNASDLTYENTPEQILRQTFGEVRAKLGPLAGKKLLDFGCGLGRLCQVAEEYGIRATGIEPDANAREKACKSSGLRAYASLGSLREAQPEAKFDIVTMWDVIEHLREPWKELKELSTMLRPGGCLLLSTPNAASLRARVERKRWENYVNPTHFYYFRRDSLRSVFRKSGFSRIEEWRCLFSYPHHGLLRRAAQRILQVAGVSGHLLFVAKAAGPHG
jgi:2-polyprenyl-3-methyl-5-hydroxy-6-metoxy-1,4-benzoquinol methylase